MHAYLFQCCHTSRSQWWLFQNWELKLGHAVGSWVSHQQSQKRKVRFVLLPWPKKLRQARKPNRRRVHAREITRLRHVRTVVSIFLARVASHQEYIRTYCSYVLLLVHVEHVEAPRIQAVWEAS